MRTWIAILAVGCGAKSGLELPESTSTAARTDAIVAVTVGEAHACALRGNGEVWCWGRNDQGQLGDDTLIDRLRPVRVVELSSAVQIAAGRNHTCARLSDGSLRCWGQRQLGQLGDGASLEGSRLLRVPSPVYVTNVSDARFVAAGEAHTCTITSGGTLCFGRNDFGELGDGRTQRSSVASAVLGLSDATQLALGNAHSCARVSDGSVACWGANDSGQLGSSTIDRCGSLDCARRAIVASLPGEVTTIAAAANRTCAVLSSKRVACWGEFMRAVDLVPALISGLDGVEEIALGAAHTCVRKTDRSVWCWGEGDRLQLGYRIDTPCPRGSGHCTATPTRVLEADAIALGGDSTCVLTSGVVRCFGRNDRGQLGDGTTIDSVVPITVAGIGAK